MKINVEMDDCLYKTSKLEFLKSKLLRIADKFFHKILRWSLENWKAIKALVQNSPIRVRASSRISRGQIFLDFF